MTWVRRFVPMLVGAGFLYLGWRLATSNSVPVDVDFLAGRVEGVALWKVLAFAFVAGGGIVGLFGVFQLARSGLVARRYRKRLGSLEAEIHQLRNLPLVPEEAPRVDTGVDRVPGVLGGVDATGG